MLFLLIVKYLLYTVEIVCSLLLIAVILVQRSKGQGMGMALLAFVVDRGRGYDNDIYVEPAAAQPAAPVSSGPATAIPRDSMPVQSGSPVQDVDLDASVDAGQEVVVPVGVDAGNPSASAGGEEMPVAPEQAVSPADSSGTGEKVAE